jgi:hypothetical protein
MSASAGTPSAAGCAAGGGSSSGPTAGSEAFSSSGASESWRNDWVRIGRRPSASGGGSMRAASGAGMNSSGSPADTSWFHGVAATNTAAITVRRQGAYV